RPISRWASPARCSTSPAWARAGASWPSIKIAMRPSFMSPITASSVTCSRSSPLSSQSCVNSDFPVAYSLGDLAWMHGTALVAPVSRPAVVRVPNPPPSEKRYEVRSVRALFGCVDDAITLYAEVNRPISCCNSRFHDVAGFQVLTSAALNVHEHLPFQFFRQQCKDALFRRRRNTERTAGRGPGRKQVAGVEIVH